MSNNATTTAIDELLTGTTADFQHALRSGLLEQVALKKSHYYYTLKFAGNSYNLCRSEDKKTWEIWSQEGDKITDEIEKMRDAKHALLWHLRSNL